MFKNTFVTLSVLLLFLFQVQTSNILLLSPVPSKSHGRWYAIVANLLAENGHHVTLLTTENPPNNLHVNITQRTLDNGYAWAVDMELEISKNPDLLDQMTDGDSYLQALSYFTDATLFGCDKLLKSEASLAFMQEFKGKSFDLIISDLFCECFFGFVHYFGYPTTIIGTPFSDYEVLDLLGLFNNPSYVPTYININLINMTFFERVHNSFHNVLFKFLLNNFYFPSHHELAKEVFGPSLPPIKEIISNHVPFAMVGYHPVLQGAKPLPPSIVPVSGLHIADPPKPLPKDIKDFLDSAKEGAILFSMGSNFKSVLMSPSKRNMILNVMKNLPQKFIWKLEENVTDLPSNVMLKSWLPQSDILGHPNTILFITHGGLNGIQEAIYHGVPLLGLPLMFDQLHNLDRLERLGAGLAMRYSSISSNYLQSMIEKMTQDNSFRIRIQELSSSFRDNPMKARETFLYWVNRALKSDLMYLRPESVKLHWYQLILLDVIAFVLTILLLSYWIIFKCVKCVLKCCRTKTKSKND